MDYEERFSDQELEQVIAEGLIYMCACPAQVAETIRTVRSLYRYQLGCIAGLLRRGRLCLGGRWPGAPRDCRGRHCNACPFAGLHG